MKTVLLLIVLLGLQFGNVSEQFSEINLDNVSRIVEIGQIANANSRIWDLTFQPESSILVAIVDHISGSPPVRYYDVTFMNSESFEVMNKTQNVLQATAITFTSDGTLFAIGNWEGAISIYDTDTYRSILDLPPVRHVVTDLAFSPDGSRLAATFGNPVLAGDGEYAVQLLAVPSGDVIFSQPFAGGVYGGGVTFDDAGEYVFFSMTDAISTVNPAIVYKWEIATGQLSETAYRLRAFSDELIFDAQTDVLFYIGEGSIHRVDPFEEVADSDLQFGFEEDAESITSMALHPDEPILAVGFHIDTPRPDGGPSITNAGAIRLYNTETGEVLAELNVPEGAITSLAFNSDGTLLASGGSDGTIRLWGIPAGGE